MLKWILLALVIVAPPAWGQGINKCVHPGTGAVAYTSNACPTSHAAWKAEFEGAGDSNDRDRMSRAEAQARIERARRAIAPPAWVTPRNAPQGAAIPISGGTRCTEARKFRDAQVAALGLNRTTEQLRAWDEYVRQACNAARQR